ncbi:hypothetical protein EDD86DRAFT_200679 [Gorgonomyces haynaldii]|nr:hypothetical protein EDD86DRAFT_200679 [Gorgonomyces haynaldii]
MHTHVARRATQKYSGDDLHMYAVHQHPEDLAYTLFQILRDSKIGVDPDDMIDFALPVKNRMMIQVLTEMASDFHGFYNFLRQVWYWGDTEYIKQQLNDPRCEERDLPYILSSSFAFMSVELLEHVMEGRDLSQEDFLEAFHSSLDAGNMEVTRYLLPHVHFNKNGHIALFWMCIYGQFDLLRQILADPRLEYPSKEDLLQKTDFEIYQHLLNDKSVRKSKYSAYHGHPGPYSVSSVQVVELVLSHRANHEKVLEIAIKYDSIDVIHHLLKKEDLVFAQYQHSLHPVIIDKQNLEVLEMLLDYPKLTKQWIHWGLSTFVKHNHWNLARCMLSHPRLGIQQDVSQMTDVDIDMLAYTLPPTN